MINFTAPAPISIRSILLPTDFSSSSERALAYGASVARRFGATLNVVTVVPEEIVDYVQPPDPFDSPNLSCSKKIGFLQSREDQIMLLLALAIGALTGLATVAFILLTERLGLRLYPVRSVAWRRVAIPIGGSLGIGYLLYRYFPDARGSGVPQTKAALFARGGVITLATVFGKFFCTSVTLASGIPLGREGPAVQVGGGIASVLGRRLGLPPEKVKALLPAGAAAAIAAAFNTPLAAVLFALEEVMGDLNAPVLGSVVIASATSLGHTAPHSRQ